MAEIVKRDDSFTVSMYDNGFLVECSGRDEDGDWVTSKKIYEEPNDVIYRIFEIFNLPKD